VLPINIINEKIYVFLWFWFIILSSLTLLGTGRSHWLLAESHRLPKAKGLGISTDFLPVEAASIGTEV
jgi:hypothetical protein